MATWERVAPSGSLGIRIGTDDAGMIFGTIVDATWSAQKLADHGYQRVTVFDRLTGQTISEVEQKSEPRRLRA